MVFDTLKPFGQAYGRTPCFPPLGLLCTMGSREIREWGK